MYMTVLFMLPALCCQHLQTEMGSSTGHVLTFMQRSYK